MGLVLFLWGARCLLGCIYRDRHILRGLYFATLCRVRPNAKKNATNQANKKHTFDLIDRALRQVFFTGGRRRSVLSRTARSLFLRTVSLRPLRRFLCFFFGEQHARKNNNTRQGVTADTAGESEDGFTFNDVLGMLFLDILIYSALAWYTGNVRERKTKGRPLSSPCPCG